MYLVLATAVVLSSENARGLLQDTFAHLSVVFYDHQATVLIGLAVAFVASLLLSARRKATTDYTAAPSLMAINRNVSEVGSKAQKYEASHDVGGGTVDQRKKGYTDMVNQYYDLSTDFYEYGWGESFHFAARAATESFGESLARHEFYLGSRLGLEKGMRALDVGCGVGGPARNIARFTGAEIVGINNNDYQIARGNAKNVRQGLAGQVSFQKGDFMHMPFEDASFDRVYTIEATCHAPDRVGCFAEILRVLKPGGTFAGYEWVTTPKYDPNNAEHVAIKKGIEVGNGLPDVNPASHVIDSMRKAGFEVLEWADHAEPDARFPVPWYQPFEPSWHPRGWKTTKMGIFFTNMMVRLLECVRLAPKGSHKMHTHLATGARTLHAGGKAEIFTPMLFFLARKPE